MIDSAAKMKEGVAFLSNSFSPSPAFPLLIFFLLQGAAAARSHLIKSLRERDAKLEKIFSQYTAPADPLQKVKTYWLALDTARLPVKSEETNVVTAWGYGFKPFYHSQYPTLFSCTYTHVASKKTVVVTKGTVDDADGHDDDDSFGITCPAPTAVASKRAYTLVITYDSSAGSREIPFRGSPGRNVLTFDKVWTSVAFIGGKAMVTTGGVYRGSKYLCEFQQFDNPLLKKQNLGMFPNPRVDLLDCGKLPTGFPIVGNTSKVVFTIRSIGGGGPILRGGRGTSTVHLQACGNGIKDGSETDVDCGGACAKKCAQSQKCRINDGQCAPRPVIAQPLSPCPPTRAFFVSLVRASTLSLPLCL